MNNEAGYYFLALLISQKITATITTTPITPNHTPALKIPVMAEQLLSVITIMINKKDTLLK